MRFGQNLIVKAWIQLDFNNLKQRLPGPFGPWQGTRQVAEVNWHAASKSCTIIVCVLGSPEEERQGPFETHWHPSDQEGNYCLLPMIQNRRNALVEPVQGRGTRLESRNRLAGQVFLAGDGWMLFQVVDWQISPARSILTLVSSRARPSPTLRMSACATSPRRRRTAPGTSSTTSSCTRSHR